MDLYNYLPIYPEFDNDVRKILGSSLVESKQASYDIYRKKEFYDFKLEKTEQKPSQSGKLMNHQTIISRFLSSHTPYNGLLVVHEPGTGKTCSSVGAIEKIRGENSSFKGALIIMKGKPLIENYINELVFTCTDGRYIPENYEELTENEKIRRVRKSISNFYEFQTFEVFSKMVRKLKDSEIIRRFSNLIIVIDEAHNLRITDDKSQYESIHRFLHTVINCKTILLTGTPMRDQPQEIASIMNLILPKSKQLPVGDDFVDDYLEEQGDSMVLKNTMKNNLKNYLHGHVSYLRAMKSDVKREFVGEHLDLTYFNLYPVEMDEFQLETYRNAFAIDKTDRKGVYNNSQQSCLFVFPDKTYGNTGFKKYVQERKIKDAEGKVKSTFNLNKQLVDSIRSGSNIEEKLENLRKFSCKYANCIKNILENKNNHFVYMEYVEGSGAILFSKILELFGFSQSKGNEKNPGLRYSIITNRTSTTKEIRDILKTYNSPQNMEGKLIRVIIGSKVIGEGFSLKNVQNVHVLTPSWNFSQTDQAIARAFRLFSHNDLEMAGIDVNVKIYLYCAITKDIESIDLYMYKTSEDKDISIKSIERSIKEASFDCGLNRERNVLPDTFNGSRECDYSFCDYSCDGLSSEQYENPEIDISTYNLFYDQEDISKIISEIVQIFKNENIKKISIESLLSKIEYSDFSIIKALETMKINNTVVKDIFNFNCFVRYDNNYVYLTYDLGLNTNFFDNYYVENFPLQEYSSFNQEVKDIYSSNLPSIFNKMKIEKDNSKKNEFLRKFSLEAQEMMLELAVLSERNGIKNVDSIREFIIENFVPYVLNIDSTKVSTLLYDKDILRCLEEDSNEWTNCSQEYVDKVDELLKTKKDEILQNKYGYYGIYESKSGKFLIRDISEEDKKAAKDNRKKTTGRVCKTSWDKKDLVKLVEIMKFEYDSSNFEDLSKEELIDLLDNKKYKDVAKTYTKSDFSKKSKDEIIRILYWGGLKKGPICDRIKKWFEDNNLLEIIVAKK
jgi:superfamily II DNA or RNA helicase